jgi:hypothetical protein
MEAWRGLQVSRGGLAVGMTMPPKGLCIISAYGESVWASSKHLLNNRKGHAHAVE